MANGAAGGSATSIVTFGEKMKVVAVDFPSDQNPLLSFLQALDEVCARYPEVYPEPKKRKIFGKWEVPGTQTHERQGEVSKLKATFDGLKTQIMTCQQALSGLSIGKETRLTTEQAGQVNTLLLMPHTIIAHLGGAGSGKLAEALGKVQQAFFGAASFTDGTLMMSYACTVPDTGFAAWHYNTSGRGGDWEPMRPIATNVLGQCLHAALGGVDGVTLDLPKSIGAARAVAPAFEVEMGAVVARKAATEAKVSNPAA